MGKSEFFLRHFFNYIITSELAIGRVYGQGVGREDTARTEWIKSELINLSAVMPVVAIDTFTTTPRSPLLTPPSMYIPLKINGKQ